MALVRKYPFTFKLLFPVTSFISYTSIWYRFMLRCGMLFDGCLPNTKCCCNWQHWVRRRQVCASFVWNTSKRCVNAFSNLVHIIPELKEKMKQRKKGEEEKRVKKERQRRRKSNSNNKKIITSATKIPKRMMIVFFLKYRKKTSISWRKSIASNYLYWLEMTLKQSVSFFCPTEDITRSLSQFPYFAF